MLHWPLWGKRLYWLRISFSREWSRSLILTTGNFPFKSELRFLDERVEYVADHYHSCTSYNSLFHGSNIHSRFFGKEETDSGFAWKRRHGPGPSMQGIHYRWFSQKGKDWGTRILLLWGRMRGKV